MPDHYEDGPLSFRTREKELLESIKSFFSPISDIARNIEFDIFPRGVATADPYRVQWPFESAPVGAPAYGGPETRFSSVPAVESSMSSAPAGPVEQGTRSPDIGDFPLGASRSIASGRVPDVSSSFSAGAQAALKHAGLSESEIAGLIDRANAGQLTGADQAKIGQAITNLYGKLEGVEEGSGEWNSIQGEISVLSDHLAEMRTQQSYGVQRAQALEDVRSNRITSLLPTLLGNIFAERQAAQEQRNFEMQFAAAEQERQRAEEERQRQIGHSAMLRQQAASVMQNLFPDLPFGNEVFQNGVDPSFLPVMVQVALQREQQRREEQERMSAPPAFVSTRLVR